MPEHDLPEVRRLITGAWLCADCLISGTGLTRAELYETLNALASTLEGLRPDVRRCDRCPAEKVAHRIG